MLSLRGAARRAGIDLVFFRSLLVHGIGPPALRSAESNDWRIDTDDLDDWTRRYRLRVAAAPRPGHPLDAA